MLADFLKNGEFAREEDTLSFWDNTKQSYIFGFNIAKEVKEITRNIAPRFLHDNTVKPQPTQLTLKIRTKRKLIVESLVEEQRLKY